MPKYIAEKCCAGKHNFRPGDEVTLSASDAKPLLADGAIRLVVDRAAEAKKLAEQKEKDDAAEAKKKENEGKGK